MGYRSSVAIAMSNELDQKFLKEISLIKDSELQNDVITLVDSFKKSYDNNSKIVYYVNDYVKWYEDDFQDVQWIMNFLEHSNSDEYRYLRSGEDLEDMSYSGELYDQVNEEYALYFTVNINKADGKTVV